MDTFILSFQIRVPFIGLRGRILVNLYWKTFRQKVLKNTEEFLMQDVLKEEGGKGNHFEIPPADFLSKLKNGAGVKCEDKNTNEEWIEEALKKRNEHLQKLQLETNIRKISVQAEIDHHENIEKTLSGPWQRLLKEAMVKLGDVARYH